MTARPVLRNVSFSIEDRGITALCAPSGAGKTTLLRILLGLEVPDSGELLGTDVRWSAVFQEDRLLEGLDAMGNLRFVLGASFDEATAATQLAALGLADARHRAGAGLVRRHEAPVWHWPGRCWRSRRRWRWTSRLPGWTMIAAVRQWRPSPARRKQSRCFW